MTEGVAGPPADVAGPPELRHFTSAFNTMAQVVRASLDRQRRLVADASHQLRNPLAAVRLRADTLEDYVAEAGTVDLRFDDRGAGPSGEPAAAAAAPGPRGGGQRQPQGRSVRRGRGVDGPRRRDRTARGVLAARRRRQRPAIALPRRPSRARGAARSPRRRATARRRAGQRAAVRRAGRHGHRVDRRPRTPRSNWSSATTAPGLPDEDLVQGRRTVLAGRDDGTGTGLGLAIAGEIAAGHGGTIAVERAPEGGLLVRYSLPAAGEATC